MVYSDNAFPLLRQRPWYPGQMGVPGSDVERGLRSQAGGVVLFVDPGHVNASATADGTDPENPLSTLQAAVTQLQTWMALGLDVAYSTIIVSGSLSESVVTGDYTEMPSYCTIKGIGASHYAISWDSGLATDPCLDLRCVGWRVEGFRFLAPTTDACIVLRHTDTGANDIAIRTIINDCLFDGLTTGLYGIETHGCYDVWITNCTFQLFNNVANDATGLITGTTPLAIPYRNHVVNCKFWDSDNGAIFPCNGSEIVDSMFQSVGYAYAMVQTLNTSIVANPGDDNVVHRNTFTGDYSIAGGYRAGAADSWVGNWAEDVAEAEVGDNGITIARPA